VKHAAYYVAAATSAGFTCFQLRTRTPGHAAGLFEHNALSSKFREIQSGFASGAK